uniref:DM2 domain-containing protein n=1 Tax=Kalanchoe fedtschenkoi TaxID=63787 RepID=A0A7N0TN16_KALFE
MAMSMGLSGTRRSLSVEPPSFSFSNNLFAAPPSTVYLSAAAASRSDKCALRLVTSATAAKTPASGKREPRGITMPKRVSSEMQAFLGVQEISRTQALKEIWAYIKQHDLQDPQNKKVIICDQKLKTIFADKDRVGFLEIAGLISPHFL